MTMKVVFLNKYGQVTTMMLPFIPRIGDTMCLFYKPYPTVKQVLLYPQSDDLKDITEDTDVVALVIL
jgi:hypothetical protein